MAKLTNKDKQSIRRALFSHIDCILANMSEKTGYATDLEHLPEKDVAEYCYKVIGLWPKREQEDYGSFYDV